MSLILTRKIGEVICIGDNIKVTVMKINCKQVRLAIEAPPEIAVNREEIARRIELAVGEGIGSAGMPAGSTP